MMDRLAKRLREIGIAYRGEFALSSGEKSTYYLDIRKAYGIPDALRMISEDLWKIIDKDVNCIATQGYGGISPASIIAVEHNLYLTLVRSEQKAYGLANIIEGYKPAKRDRVAIIDDVLTTGGSLRKIIREIELTGASILGCYVVVKRGEADLVYPLKWLLTADQLL